MVLLKATFWEGMVFLGLSVFFFVIAKYINEVITPFNENKELGEQKNIAVSISLCGYMVAVTCIIIGALLGPSTTLGIDVLNFCLYTGLGILLLNASRIINDKFILRKFSNVDELVRDQNLGAGVVEFGSYVASGLVVGGAVHGQGGGVHTALAFFALSQVALILFSHCYDLVTPFDTYKEIEEDNEAVGIAFGGTLIALGIILLKGSVGSFVSWQYNLTNFGLSVGISMVFLPFVRVLVDKLLLPFLKINDQISKNRNKAVALIEMTVAICFAIFLYFTIDFDINF